jgi:hypothetical protein
VYSDTFDQMFKLGSYKIDQGGVIDFNYLEIPCDDYLIFNLVSNDPSTTDGSFVRYPCYSEG